MKKRRTHFSGRKNYTNNKLYYPSQTITVFILKRF